ncbi:MAG: HAD hydrolase family protein [Oscillospiraceae bacterium]|nr:HAD hydrolase family protein [Oscillospiraceae bacterium]
MGKFDRVLLASDFDNTLVFTKAALDAGSTELPPMPARNREALDYFTRCGGAFSVSTGRALPAFARYAAELPINAPCVIANGAGLYDFRTERYMATAFIDESVRGAIAALLAYDPQLPFEIYHTDRRIHAMHPNRYILNHEHLTRTKVMPVSSFDEVDMPLVKLLFEDDRDKLDALSDFIRAQDWAQRYELIFSSDNLLEMTARGATKGQMVLRLAELLGIDRSDVYCIGDHANDVSMAEVSAVRFAPANAIEEMRMLPDMHVVSHCRDGAIADVIEALDRIYP